MAHAPLKGFEDHVGKKCVYSSSSSSVCQLNPPPHGPCYQTKPTSQAMRRSACLTFLRVFPPRPFGAQIDHACCASGFSRCPRDLGDRQSCSGAELVPKAPGKASHGRGARFSTTLLISCFPLSGVHVGILLSSHLLQVSYLSFLAASPLRLLPLVLVPCMVAELEQGAAKSPLFLWDNTAAQDLMANVKAASSRPSSPLEVLLVAPWLAASVQSLYRKVMRALQSRQATGCPCHFLMTN